MRLPLRLLLLQQLLLVLILPPPIARAAAAAMRAQAPFESAPIVARLRGPLPDRDSDGREKKNKHQENIFNAFSSKYGQHIADTQPPKNLSSVAESMNVGGNIR